MEKSKSPNKEAVRESMQAACDVDYDLLDGEVLCQSVGAMPLKAPLIVKSVDSLESVLDLLQTHKTGCVIVVDDNGNSVGIFTERDFILKVAKQYEQEKKSAIGNFMTPDPVVQTLDCTIAYALTLMSEGGFRNLPIVDAENRPIGVIAVKDVIDFLVTSFMNKLLAFPVDV